MRMIEVQLSQGAKPGAGGILPGPRGSYEIAEARGIEPGKTCISPARHSAFSTPVELLRFIEQLRHLSGGKPLGIMICIGHISAFIAFCRCCLLPRMSAVFI